MRIARSLFLFGTLTLAALGACSPSGGNGTPDAMTTGDVVTGADATGGADAREGGTSGDPCLTTMGPTLSSAGCNGGFVTGANPANGPEGTCMTNATDMGTCVTPNAFCAAASETATTGVCYVTCTPPSEEAYSSNGGCPRGFRCFGEEDEEGDVSYFCYRDCNATNACPAGQMCDADGTCVDPS